MKNGSKNKSVAFIFLFSVHSSVHVAAFYKYVIRIKQLNTAGKKSNFSSQMNNQNSAPLEFFF